MIRRIGKIGCALALTGLAGLLLATEARANLITNGSFESGTTGWTVGGGGIDLILDSLPSSGWQASDGSYSVDLNAFTPGSVATSFTTVVGVPIVVTFDLSGNPGLPRDLKTLDVLVDGVVTGSFSYDTSVQLNTAANMKYVTESFTFTPTATSTTLTFQSTTNAGASFPAAAQGPVLDNVVATQVPEPAALLMMGAGLLGLFGLRRGTQRAA